MAVVVDSAQTGSVATGSITGRPAATKGNLRAAMITQTGTASQPTLAGWTFNATKAQLGLSTQFIWLATMTAAGGETAIEPTPAAGGTIQGIVYWEVSGLGETVDAIVKVDNNPSNTTVTSPALTTTDAGDVILAGVGAATASGAISPWSASNAATPVAVATTTSRTWGASYIPAATLAAVTLTSTWATAKAVGMLVVALKPTSGEETKKGSGALSVGARLAATAVKIAKATGALSVGPRIVGTAGASTRTGSGALSVGVRLTGAGKTQGAEQTGHGSGSLSAGPRVSATAGQSVRSGAGALSAGPRLTPTSASVRSATGKLSVGVRTSTSGSTRRSGQGTLSTGARLTSAAASIRRGTGSLTGGPRITGYHVGKLIVGTLSVGARIEGVGRGFANEPPTSTPLAGHVAVGRTGRLSRSTGRIKTTNSGRARR